VKEHIPHKLIEIWQNALKDISDLSEGAPATAIQRRKLITALCEVAPGDLFSPLVGTIEVNDKLNSGALHIQGEQGLSNLSEKTH